MQNSRTGIIRGSSEEQSTDIYCMITDIAHQWMSILLLTVTAVIISYVLLTEMHPLDYATTATMVVTNVNEESSTTVNSTGTDVYENLNYAADSASRLKNILESNELKNTVAKELGYKQFIGSVSASTLGESNLLEIKVRATSPLVSYKEAESILNNYMMFSSDLVGGIELTVLERPKVQENPESPLQNIKYAILLGGLVFLIVCASLAALSLTRDTVRNSKEAESKIDARLLSTILHEKKYKNGRNRIRGEKTSILITDPVTSFQYAEGMRKLATRILNEMTEHKQKVLMISSATENEGKSTIAVNVALAMSQIDKSVLLIDMDFRKPSIYKNLNMQNAEFSELSTYLTEKNPVNAKGEGLSAEDLICNVPGTELSAILNRKSVPQAMEKHSKSIKYLINELSEKVDFIVVDTAPISLVSDAEELVSMVDTSIVVVRQHWVESKEINDTIDVLGGSDHVLGCVLNNAHKRSIGTASSGYGYGYGGQYAE